LRSTRESPFHVGHVPEDGGDDGFVVTFSSTVLEMLIMRSAAPATAERTRALDTRAAERPGACTTDGGATVRASSIEAVTVACRKLM